MDRKQQPDTTSSGGPRLRNKRPYSIQKPYCYLVTDNPARHHILEPEPTHSPVASKPAAQSPGQQATALCDEMHNLHSVNSFFFSAIEALFAEAVEQGQQSEIALNGLVINLRWLRWRSEQVLAAVDQLHASITKPDRAIEQQKSE